jgi:diacylglycerol O-acyltransferase
VGDTLVRAARDPEFAADRARATVTDVLGAAVSVGSGGDGVAQLVGELAEGALRRERPGHGPLTGEVSQGRRSALVSVPAADLRAVSRQHGVSVHDVVLAGVTGALRSWLLSRGASLGPGTVLTALTPMAVVDEGTEPSAVGCQAATRFQRLPVGEPDAVVRLWLLGHGTQTHRAAGRAVAADVLADLAGFAPATLHAIGLRAAADVGRPYDLVISNAPGPRQPHYLAGATVDASWAMLPLTAGHQLGVGVTSYAGRVAFTLVGAVDGPDLDVLADGLRGALDELIATSSSSGRAP